MPFRRASAGDISRPGPWLATLRTAAIVLAIAFAIGALAVRSITSRGLSTHEDPSRIEAVIARAMRAWATPDAIRATPNPVIATPMVLDEALAHYADHCATCHANDGSGQTAIGQGLYPKAPDMRASTTQSLSDGELFSIIEHGIRLTGMPGWGNGTQESERDSWGLVHVIRRLPALSPADIERMQSMNPKTRAEWQQEEEARRFLLGQDINTARPEHAQH